MASVGTKVFLVLMAVVLVSGYAIEKSDDFVSGHRIVREAAPQFGHYGHGHGYDHHHGHHGEYGHGGHYHDHHGGHGGHGSYGGDYHHGHHHH